METYAYCFNNISKADKLRNLSFTLEHNKSVGFIIDDDNLTRIYLRGVFISCGSVNDPKKSRYHLEFLVDTKEYADTFVLKQKLQ